MTNKYIAYNGIVIGAENWVKKDGGVEYTPYIFSEFSPNEVSTTFQKDDLITDGSEYSNYRYEPRIVSLRGHILPRKGESVEELRIKLYEKCGGKTAHRLMYSSSTHGYFAEAVADAPVTAKLPEPRRSLILTSPCPASFGMTNSRRRLRHIRASKICLCRSRSRAASAVQFRAQPL